MLIEKLVTDLDCRSGHISLEALDFSGIKQRFSHGMSEEQNQLVVSHYHKIDFWTQALAKIPKGKFYPSEAMLSKSDMVGTEFYEDYCKKFDLTYLTGAYIECDHNSGVRLALHHTTAQGPLGQKINHLNLLAPHLRRAAKLHQQVSPLLSQNRNTTKLLDAFPSAMLVADKNATISYMNSAADHLLSKTRLLKTNGKKLILNDPQHIDLNQLICDAVLSAQGQSRKYFAGDLIVRDTQGKAQLEIKVEPFSTFDQEFGLQYRKAMALIFIHQIGNEIQLNQQTVAKVYNLTKKELLLAEHLTQGKSLEQISQETHRSLNTIKTHLKSLFLKTQSNGQVQLVTKLLSYKSSIT